MTRNTDMLARSLPWEPATLRRLQRTIATLGGILQRTSYPDGREATAVHLDGKAHTMTPHTLPGAGWLDCRRAPFCRCEAKIEPRGNRAVCRACGSMSKPLPGVVREWLAAQPPHSGQKP